MWSNRPAVRMVLTGMTRRNSTSAMAPIPAATQKSACQTKFSVTKALMGRPSAPPTPSVALTSAIDEPSFPGCRVSRRITMPNGITPMPVPCRAPADDHRDHGRRQGADDGSGDEQGEQDDGDPALAVHVAELAGYRSADGGDAGESEDGDDGAGSRDVGE
jgi:hypothetical protein